MIWGVRLERDSNPVRPGTWEVLEGSDNSKGWAPAIVGPVGARRIIPRSGLTGREMNQIPEIYRTTALPFEYCSFAITYDDSKEKTAHLTHRHGARIADQLVRLRGAYYGRIEFVGGPQGLLVGMLDTGRFTYRGQKVTGTRTNDVVFEPVVLKPHPAFVPWNWPRIAAVVHLNPLLGSDIPGYDVVFPDSLDLFRPDSYLLAVAGQGLSINARPMSVSTTNLLYTPLVWSSPGPPGMVVREGEKPDSPQMQYALQKAGEAVARELGITERDRDFPSELLLVSVDARAGVPSGPKGFLIGSAYGEWYMVPGTLDAVVSFHRRYVEGRLDRRQTFDEPTTFATHGEQLYVRVTLTGAIEAVVEMGEHLTSRQEAYARPSLEQIVPLVRDIQEDPLHPIGRVKVNKTVPRPAANRLLLPQSVPVPLRELLSAGVLDEQLELGNSIANTENRNQLVVAKLEEARRNLAAGSETALARVRDSGLDMVGRIGELRKLTGTHFEPIVQKALEEL
jgi:hypothetical protein